MSSSEVPGPRVSEFKWGPILAILDVLIVSLCVGIALIPLLPAYGTAAALYAIIAGVIAGAVPVVVGAFAQWRLPLTLVVSFALYVVVGGSVAFGKNLFLGFVPSGVSIQATLTGIVTAWKEALTLEPPLGQSDGVLLFPFLVAFIGALLTTFVVVWRRTWVSSVGAMTVVYAILVIAILWGTQKVVFQGFIGIVLLVMLLLWSAWRQNNIKARKWASLLGFVGVSVMCAVLISPLVVPESPRFVLRNVVVPPFDPRDQVSPLSLYRAFIKDQSEVPLVTVSNLPQGATVRLATLDSYDGVVWDVSGDGSRAGSGAFRRIGERINQTATGTAFSATIKIEQLQGVWTPTIGYLNEIDFDTKGLNDFRFNDATGAGVTLGGVNRGTSYRISGVIPLQPTDEELGDADVGKIAISDVVNSPEVVSQEAIRLARESANVPLALRKYQEFFSNRGFFSHGEATGGYPSLSGHGAARMSDFLSVSPMVGDAEQYASAMALMARSQGIPSRVVMGFAPQEVADSMTFTGADMTAWVEIYYDEFGWVSYFPTPDESQTPKASNEESAPDPEPEAIQQPPDPQPQVTPPSVVSEDTKIETDREDAATPIDWAAVAKRVVIFGVPVALLFAFPVTVLLLKLRRLNRRRSASAKDSVIGGWQEFVDVARDFGIRPEKEFTRREVALFIEAGNPEVQVRKLADNADMAHFAYESVSDDVAAQQWDAVAANKAQLFAGASRWKRFVARLNVSSLLENRRERRTSVHGSAKRSSHSSQSVAVVEDAQDFAPRV